MSARLFTPMAERELREAAAWTAQENPAAAEALLDGALHAADLLRVNPRLGRVRFDLAPERFRFWPLRGFPYLLVCDTEADPPVIVRFVHGARDLPGLLE